MSRTSPLVPTLLSALLVALVLASAATAADPTRTARVPFVEHRVHVESAEGFDAVLLDAGYAAEEIEAQTTALRRAAVRHAYDAGDAAAIAEIEKQLSAVEIEIARNSAGYSRAPVKATSTRNIGCSAGRGASARFTVMGPWNSTWRTSTGTNSSTQYGSCNNYVWGCTVSDSIGGHPSLSWQAHLLGAPFILYHSAWCN